MAVLQSIQTGNFLDASTWAVVDATSYVDFRSSEQGVTTIQTNATVAFTPGAITVAGISVQVGTRVATPTGTFTVRLWNNTVGVVVKDVVINVVDLPNTNGTANGSYIGWTYFRFDSSVTLIDGNQYSVRVFSSVNSQLTVYRSATVNNWSRALVTTTTAAPLATDIFLISGVYTSAGVNSIITITMNNTSLVTEYGNCYVGSNGRFNYGTASSTNYVLRLAGNIFVGIGAIFTIGTVANPIPATSTAVLEINCASSIQFQIFNFGTFETKYATTVLHRALLNADIVAGATTMTTNVSTGWRQNDVIVIPSTTRTTTQHERVTLSFNASGTTLTHNATSFAHDGNATIYIQADLANLTRNIKIRSVSAAARSRFLQGVNATTTLFDVEFFQWTGCVHNSGTLTYAGSFNLQQCTFWGTTNTSTVLSNLNTSSNIISNNIFYNYVDATQNIDNENIIIGFTAFTAWSGTLGNNNVISSCSQAGGSGTFRNGSTGNRFYATGGNGAIYTTQSPAAYTVSNWVFFNNNIAIRFLAGTSTTGVDRISFERFENCHFYGNNINIDITGAGLSFRRLWFNNCFLWAGKTGLLTTIGYFPFTNDYIHFSNCTFGRRPDGVDSLFSTSCLRGGQLGTTLTNCLFYGITASFASTTQFTSVNGFNGITSLKHNGVTNEYRQYQANGFIQNDNVITYNGLSTIRITPQVVTNKTFSNPVRVAVQSGQTCTISVAIRKSVAGDGAVYNGNQPRLMYSYNPLAGNLTETIGVSTTNAANGVWQTLTYTTPVVSHNSVLEFYIDCDGTTGWINVDDFKTTTFNDTRGMDYWSSIGVYTEPNWTRPGGNNVFLN